MKENPDTNCQICSTWLEEQVKQWILFKTSQNVLHVEELQDFFITKSKMFSQNQNLDRHKELSLATRLLIKIAFTTVSAKNDELFCLSIAWNLSEGLILKPFPGGMHTSQNLPQLLQNHNMSNHMSIIQQYTIGTLLVEECRAISQPAMSQVLLEIPEICQLVSS